ncbi:serotransferrin [Dorcoceras hygrometricum]|uniref:Serotransferrin n=1 Tax=Dorcoceras hygrometricum TaxID=472368 RepID=A0A2Z7BM11_9LAMI|nr:serotransferrin [Dorcoceras hygrometricum]
MSGKESDNSVESVTSKWHDLVPIHINEMVPVIYLDSDDEVEILPSPHKRRNTGIEQPVAESSGIKKDPKEQQSPSKNPNDMGSKTEAEVDTKVKDKGQSWK